MDMDIWEYENMRCEDKFPILSYQSPPAHQATIYSHTKILISHFSRLEKFYINPSMP